jgi:formylmethanofuran:tetrahydromethanopterin formyltransferase
LLHGCREQGGGEFFIECEEELYALAVVRERLRAIAEVNGAVQFGVGFDESGRHRQWVV